MNRAQKKVWDRLKNGLPPTTPWPETGAIWFDLANKLYTFDGKKWTQIN